MNQATENWRQEHPGAMIGILSLENVSNPRKSPELDKAKPDLEESLKKIWPDRATIKADPVMVAYQAYYKKFKKTYHLLGQLESIAFKGRSLPRVAALVEAMFMAELKNRLLTAGHDLDLIRGGLTVDSARGGEEYVTISGREQRLKAGDMFIADEAGIISSILGGPDKRTMINPQTTRAVFTIYCPAGIEAESLNCHLGDIVSYATLIDPLGEVIERTVISA